MERIKGVLTMILILTVQGVWAQDYNDTNVALSQLDVKVPEAAISEIYEAYADTEANSTFVGMTTDSLVGRHAEIGLYALKDTGDNTLYLNLTSESGGVGSGFDVERCVDVQFEPGSTFPRHMNLKITPQGHGRIVNRAEVNTGTEAIMEGVALGTTTPIGTDVLLVRECVCSDDENYGVRLIYTLERTGTFLASQVEEFQATIRYTISDL
ncbi:hypothetical protein BFP72_00575 [Reichenbachiella sp. 5M10]|uniref:hypothetical protein n=1 Tax=Reichenbachiella sp. 5M10 TaxID=1889772 RepID=UPI000C15DAAB|nr:hypothetical protein [Reichenbachiella sp. 5M10]PIB34028.1 hypothetical protein BFP72_00575 [Reichenbachiella sp. 5M10]